MKEYWFFRITKALSNLLPRGFAYWIGLRMADFLFFKDKKGRDAVISNIRHILKAQSVFKTEREIRLMARRTFQHFGKYLVDFFRFTSVSDDHLKRLFKFENMEHFEQAKAMNKGVILVTAHFGNWELGGAVLTAMGNKISAVVLANNIGKTNDLFQAQRRRRGMEVLPLGQAARRSMKALRNNEMVAMLCDRDFTSHNVLIDFFGQPARMPAGPARIALKTMSPIVPGFLIRMEDDTFLFKFYPPVIPEPGMEAEEIRAKIRDVMQLEIAQNPSQWFVFEDFWKPAPVSETAIVPPVVAATA